MTDTPQLLLVHHLKTLKLPTFLREYDKLARQCAAEGAGHVRYLVRLAELELIDRERRMVERRIRPSPGTTSTSRRAANGSAKASSQRNGADEEAGPQDRQAEAQGPIPEPRPPHLGANVALLSTPHQVIPESAPRNIIERGL